MKLQVINNSGVPLRYATDGSAGIDLAAHTLIGSISTGYHHHIHRVGTGVQVEIPSGYVGLLIARSSLHTKGWKLANAVGVVDADYRGEIMVDLQAAAEPYDQYIPFGQRIAQLVIVPCPRLEIEEVTELPETSRGSGGFGSTDIHKK